MNMKMMRKVKNTMWGGEKGRNWEELKRGVRDEVMMMMRVKIMVRVRDDGQGHDASKDEESKALTPHPGKWIQAHTPKPRQHIGLHLTMHKKYPACTWHFGWEVWGDKNNQDIVFYESFKCRLQVSFGESFLCFWNSRLHLLNQRIVPCFILCLMKVMKNQIQSKFYQQFSQDLQTTL